MSMIKKKMSGAEKRLWNKMEEQRWLIENIVRMFYPGGEKVQFSPAIRVGTILKDHCTAARRFPENEHMLSKCRMIHEDAKKTGSGSMEIDFYRSAAVFQSQHSGNFRACVTFKAAHDGFPIHLTEGYENENVVLRFLIDSKEKEAVLVLETRDARDQDGGFTGGKGSYICLPEFHGIILGHDYYEKRRNNTPAAPCFIVSFSRAEGKCVVDRVFDFNLSLLSGPFPTVEPAQK